MTDKNIPNDLNYLLNLIRFLSETLDMNLNFSVFREKNSFRPFLSEYNN